MSHFTYDCRSNYGPGAGPALGHPAGQPCRRGSHLPRVRCGFLGSPRSALPGLPRNRRGRLLEACADRNSRSSDIRPACGPLYAAVLVPSPFDHYIA